MLTWYQVLIFPPQFGTTHRITAIANHFSGTSQISWQQFDRGRQHLKCETTKIVPQSEMVMFDQQEKIEGGIQI
jgi:hypothetical protein